MKSKELIRAVSMLTVVGVLAWSLGTAAATTIWSEDFSGSPDLSSGNWHSNIAYANDPASIGTWDTSLGYAASNSSPAGSVGYTAANTQYMFTSAEKAAFGGLYDSGSGTVGGGSTSGTLYVRFDCAIAATQDPGFVAGFGWFQLRRGSTTAVEELNNGLSGNSLSIGKEWGTASHSGIVANPAAGDGWTHFALNPTDIVDVANHTFVMKIDYAGGAADSVSIYQDPLVAGESAQPSSLTTALAGAGDLSFDSFLIRAGNQGTNWHFDNVKFGTSFADVAAVPEPTSAVLSLIGIIGILAYAWRRHK